MPSPALPKRILLCEGLEGASFPEVRYVVQATGDSTKVCIFEGADKLSQQQLQESVGGAYTLVESVDQLQLVERDGKRYVNGGRWFVEGVAQRSGVENANKRKYSRKIWERIIADPKSKQQTAIRERGMVGHFEHPSDGRTNGPSVALLTISANLREDGTVWAKHELLDTPNGRILQELTEKKVRWGVSSRGTGSIDEQGNVNESDYEMECWDGVMRPSTPGAFPHSVGDPPKMQESANNLADVRSAHAAQISEALEKPLTKDVLESPTAAIRYIADLFKTTEPIVAPAGQEDANRIFKLLCKRLDEVESLVLTAAVDESARLARGGDVQARTGTQGISCVLEHLRNRVVAALKAAHEAESRLADLEKEAGQQRRALQEVERENTSLKARLAAATAVITERMRRSVDEESPRTVAQYIDEVPALERFRAVLEATPENGLESVVEALLPEALEEPATDPMTEETQPRRSILPRGVSISASLPAKQPVGAGPALNEADARRVRVTAAAVARLAGVLNE